MPRSWLYRLGREALIRQLTQLELDTTGTVKQLRRRVSEYCVLHPEFSHELDMPNPPELRVDLTVEPTEENRAKTINQRKWGCHFDRRDPIVFL